MSDDGPSPSDMQDWADYDDALARPFRQTRCRCGGDMPGICPGPRNCPMVEQPEDKGEDDDG